MSWHRTPMSGMGVAAHGASPSSSPLWPLVESQDPIDSALPTRKPNWDLRRAIAPQLAMLDRRTQEAIVTLMKQEEANPGSISAMPS